MLDLGTPDDFRGDPYGWLTNQMAHVLCGLGGAWLVATLAGRLGIGDLATALARVSGGPVDAAHLLALMAAALAAAGQVTIAAAGGVTIKKHSSLNAKTFGQEAVLSLAKIATDTWRLFGHLELA